MEGPLVEGYSLWCNILSGIKRQTSGVRHRVSQTFSFEQDVSRESCLVMPSFHSRNLLYLNEHLRPMRRRKRLKDMQDFVQSVY